MIVAFTGHRPPKAGLSYPHDGPGDKLAVGLVRAELRKLAALSSNDLHAVVGGALGFDTLAARACYLESVPYDLYMPFEGQAARWPDEAKQRFAAMRRFADSVVVVSEGGYSAQKMQVRNEAMVDAADVLVAWWDQSPGGTANCILYASHKPNLRLVNLYEEVR